MGRQKALRERASEGMCVSDLETGQRADRLTDKQKQVKINTDVTMGRNLHNILSTHEFVGALVDLIHTLQPTRVQ